MKVLHGYSKSVIEGKSIIRISQSLKSWISPFQSKRLLISFKTFFAARREELEMNTALETKQNGIEDLIPERKKKIAFLDLLLQMRLSDGSALSNSDIQEEVDTFMFEGHDTTTNSLAWTIFLIGLNPQVILL